MGGTNQALYDHFIKTVCDSKKLTLLEDCADSWSKGYDRIKRSYNKFRSIEKYKIDQKTADLICPCTI